MAAVYSDSCTFQTMMLHSYAIAALNLQRERKTGSNAWFHFDKERWRQWQRESALVNEGG